MNDVIQDPLLTPEEIISKIQSESSFEKFFKKNAASSKLGYGYWKLEANGHRLVLPDGSTIRLKFFATVKKIYNTKNIEVPGRESWLSYIDIAVRPAGIKGYEFRTELAQHVWAGTPSKALVLHQESLNKLVVFAEALGIDMSLPNSWETYFANN
jgi:hypothetical protein